MEVNKKGTEFNIVFEDYLTPLREMKGLCKYCVGECLRLEDENFNGTYRCKDFQGMEQEKKQI